MFARSNKFIGRILLAAAIWWPLSVVATGVDIAVYKNPQCGCCDKWVEYLRQNGFRVKTKTITDTNQVKKEHGVPLELASCHTAIVDGYIIEGHVPAATIKRLLKERPAIKGIAVPGMPMGSPGMEGPYAQRYNVLTFDAKGQTKIYESR